jgi:murein DD-endopeptidase MepM/ murein hydrolase activator NlpD
MPHLGVDYAAPYGTPVSSSADGVVVFAGRKGPNGNMVEIRHNSVYTTYYLHLSGFARGIRRGRKVGQGQVIGYVGATGRATGPHLDYRIKRYGSFINPLTAEFPSGEPVNEQYIAEFIKKRDQMLAALPKPPSRIRIANSSRKDDTVKVSNNRTDG